MSSPHSEGPSSAGYGVLLSLALLVPPVAASAQTQESRSSVGLRYGVDVHRGGIGWKHVGAQAWLPFKGFSLVPAVDVLPEFPDDPLDVWSGYALNAYLTIRKQPFGRGWLPEVGYGLVADYRTADNSDRSVTITASRTRTHAKRVSIC